MDGCDAYKAFDHNNSSYWSTATGKQNNAYIGYDFGEKQSVSHCLYRYGDELDGNTYKAKDIKLQCSNDNNTWIDASEIINLTPAETSKVIKNTKVNEGYRYWRIYIISSFANYSVASDLQFYNTNTSNMYNMDDVIVSILKDENTMLEIDNLISHNFLEKISKLDEDARTKIINDTNILDKLNNKKIRLINQLNSNEDVIYSSIYSDAYTGYKAFDKNSASYWCTAKNNQNDAYLGYDFNNKVFIKNVEIYSNYYRCKEVKLQCSNDNNTWIDASDIITFEDNNDVHTIESNIQDVVLYQYWRVYVITGYQSDYTGIYECEFYGL